MNISLVSHFNEFKDFMVLCHEVELIKARLVILAKLIVTKVEGKIIFLWFITVTEYVAFYLINMITCFSP